MHVIDAIWKRANKFDWINALPNQVAWIEVETEFFPMANCFQSSLSSIDIECDFGRVYFECEPHPTLAEHVEDQLSMDTVKRMGIDFAQGFFIGRPQPLLMTPIV